VIFSHLLRGNNKLNISLDKYGFIGKFVIKIT